MVPIRTEFPPLIGKQVFLRQEAGVVQGRIGEIGID